MRVYSLSPGCPTHSADRHWYHLWTGDLLGSWKLPLFPCPRSTWTGLLIPRVREEERCQNVWNHRKNQIQTAGRCQFLDAPNKTLPGSGSPAWEMGPHQSTLCISLLLVVILRAHHWSWGRWQVSHIGPQKQNQCEERAATEHGPSFLRLHSGPRLSTAPSRKWALSCTLDQVSPLPLSP